MKNWLTIGQFAKASGLSPRALRIYEDMNMLVPPHRGDNGYRYYQESQLSEAARLKEFKDLGFLLEEVKALLQADHDLDKSRLVSSLSHRLDLVREQSDQLQDQRRQIEQLLSSLKNNTKPIAADERRAIMSYQGNPAIVVTGIQGLQKTAEYIQKHLQDRHIPLLFWSEELELPESYILVLPEENLGDKGVENLAPNVIVLNSVSGSDSAIQENYLRLYNFVGSHVTTVIHAEDQALLEIVSNKRIRDTYYQYYSKNRALEKQIKKIGGLVCSGSEISLYGYNLQKETVHLKLESRLGFADELALLSSITAVMKLGLPTESLCLK